MSQSALQTIQETIRRNEQLKQQITLCAKALDYENVTAILAPHTSRMGLSAQEIKRLVAAVISWLRNTHDAE